MYEILVLGATYAAAGIAHQYRENCLVLERRAQAGYEFFGAGQNAEIYSYLKECHTVFCAEPVSVEKTEDGFLCVTHGVDGYRSYTARRVVDTRCNAAMSHAKTYDLLVENRGRRAVMKCSVPLSCGYPEARRIAHKAILNFSPEERLILMADEFDYCIKEGYPKEKDGIFYLPSKAYATPSLAFEAGASLGKEGGR